MVPRADGTTATVEERPQRHELDDALAGVLAQDERLLWHVTPDDEAVRTLAWVLGAFLVMDVLFLVGFAVWAGFFTPVIAPVIGGMIPVSIVVVVLLYRVLSSYEAAATSRRLVVTNGSSLLRSTDSLEWDRIERITVNVRFPLTDAGTVEAHAGGTLDQLTGSGTVSIPFVGDPERQAERLEVLREEHATATGREP